MIVYYLAVFKRGLYIRNFSLQSVKLEYGVLSTQFIRNWLTDNLKSFGAGWLDFEFMFLFPDNKLYLMWLEMFRVSLINNYNRFIMFSIVDLRVSTELW